MFLDVNVYNLVYTSIFLLFFVISYFIIMESRFDNLFKKGKVWAIRLAQVLLAIIIAYLLATAIMSLVNSTQF